MKVKLMTFAFLSVLIVIGCRPSTNEKAEEAVEENKNDLSGLTYYDLLKQVFEDDGFSFTWNGEALPNDFISSLSITKDGMCGSGECGDLLWITNSSAGDSLEVIVKADYDLEGDTGQITRQYVIPANGKVIIGCSHLCVEGTPYAFEREIIGSKIFKEVAI